MKTILSLLLLAAAGAADCVQITEVVTDPQIDWSGNGIVSSVDEFVELYNAADDPIDLTGFTLAFDDTTPSSYVFGTTTSGTLAFSAGSTLEALLPGDYVVLINPPGVLNNTIDVRLIDPDGTLAEVLGVDDGNATGPADEAVSRAWSGEAYLPWIVRTAATPGAAPPPVAEPAGLCLALFSAAAVFFASRRRRRRGCDRTPCGTPPPRSCARG